MAHAESRATSVFLLVAFLTMQSAIFPGVQANFVDVAPNFSGAIFSIANFISALLGIIGPIGVGFIVTESVSLPMKSTRLFISAIIQFKNGSLSGKTVGIRWRQKPQAPTPQAPVRIRQTRKVANAKLRIG